MAAVIRSFGQTAQGQPVKAYSLENRNGTQAVFIDYGAALQSLRFKNRRGTLTDVVLGFDSVEGYENQDAYIGATVGRMANRIGDAVFSLGGREYRLFPNNGKNHLHGGKKGFDKYVWQAESGENFVRFSRLSPDGEEGYPGNLQISVTYSLTDSDELHIAYEALCDTDTIVSLTNHSYFNLNGGGSVLDQQLMINAHRCLELGPGLIPTGRSFPVDDGPFDFRTSKPIGRDIEADDPQLKLGGGYDHNFILSGSLAAIAYSENTGIELYCYTQLPGMQLYTANFLGEFTGKGAQKMGPRQAFCLETQLFPDAMARYGFPSPVLHAGEKLSHETIYKLSLK